MLQFLVFKFMRVEPGDHFWFTLAKLRICLLEPYNLLHITTRFSVTGVLLPFAVFLATKLSNALTIKTNNGPKIEFINVFSLADIFNT